MNNTVDTNNSLPRTLISIFLITGIPFLCCYFLFFAFHEQITHIHRPSDEMIKQLVDAHFYPALRNTHDGIETNVLFLMFLIIGPAGFLLYKSPLPSKILAGIGLIMWIAFFYKLQFVSSIYSKLDNTKQIASAVAVALSFTGIVMVGRWLYSKNALITYLLIISGLALICFISFSDINYSDSATIMAPALKVLQGGGIRSAYFQYDFIPSIPAWFIVKNDGSMHDFRLVIEAFMFIFLVASFTLARNFFVHKGLSFYLLALFIVFRVYMCSGAVISFPQSTPIRLDWWLLLFAASFFWGLDNFKFGLCLFLIVILQNSLGIFYLFCYLVLLGFLLLFQLYSIYTLNCNVLVLPTISSWLKQYSPNIILGLAGVIVYWLITGHIISEGILIYKDFQFGFLPIVQNSVYWYFAAVFTFCFALVLIFKERLSVRYWYSSLFLLFLLAGNSVYFYGRSHEGNIPLISGSLLFIVVLCSDVLLQIFGFEFRTLKRGHKFAGLAPIGMILLVTMVNYSQIFAINTHSFVTTLKSGKWDYPVAYPQKNDFATVTDLTEGSKKVFFMTYEGNSDFYFYYWGHYQMLTKFVPIENWLIASEKIAFANEKLNEGYFIVAFANDTIFNRDFLPKLDYKKMAIEKRYMAISK